jgi:hypothetical protein
VAPAVVALAVVSAVVLALLGAVGSAAATWTDSTWTARIGALGAGSSPPFALALLVSVVCVRVADDRNDLVPVGLVALQVAVVSAWAVIAATVAETWYETTLHLPVAASVPSYAAVAISVIPAGLALWVARTRIRSRDPREWAEGSGG